ncbi:ExeA family protein [Neptuniibacter sp.]|uniref:ExeA family protein n=1 Tax=Neptuniibacter sp. TaxID=1962643 RepID=UPI003B59D0CB
MLELKNTLNTLGLRQSDLHRDLGISGATLSLLINKEEWPKRINEEDLKKGIRSFLVKNGAKAEQLNNCFERATMYLPPLPPVNKKTDEEKAQARQQAKAEKQQHKEENEIMLLRKQTLSPDARRAFGFMRNPFDEVHREEEVFLNPDYRYVREAMRHTARHGGFMAVVAESGAGKSTLRKDLESWVAKDEKIIVIQPYILGLEDNDMAGKTLKASHIAEAIMRTIAPHIKLPRSPETRFRMVHETLRDSYRSGKRHVLIIEEAHGLPIPTLKHLKRFFELEDGFDKLIGIILIGQTELGHKLNERDPRVREVVQRCEVVTVNPITVELEDYLRHRFAIANKELNSIMDAEAIEALRHKLSGRGNASVLYPLAIHNVLIAALNEACAIGVPTITADLILEV